MSPAGTRDVGQSDVGWEMGEVPEEAGLLGWGSRPPALKRQTHSRARKQSGLATGAPGADWVSSSDPSRRRSTRRVEAR